MSKNSFFGLFFWQNDYLLRGRGRGIPLVEKIRLVVFDRLPINRKACPGYCSVCCRLGYLYSDQLFNRSHDSAVTLWRGKNSEIWSQQISIEPIGTTEIAENANPKFMFVEDQWRRPSLSPGCLITNTCGWSYPAMWLVMSRQTTFSSKKHVNRVKISWW